MKKAFKVVLVLSAIALTAVIAVFAAYLDPGRNGRTHPFCIIHFRRGNQNDILWIFSCSLCGLCDTFLHCCNTIFEFSAFLLRHVFTTILFCKFLPLTII